MKVIIAGGRNYKFTKDDWELLNNLHKEYVFTEIISGGATGADSEGERFARKNKIKIVKFEAKWLDFTSPCVIKYNKRGEKYNALAGFKRNEEMAKYGEGAILFPGGRGTMNMQKFSKQYDLKIIYDVEEKE